MSLEFSTLTKRLMVLNEQKCSVMKVSLSICNFPVSKSIWFSLRKISKWFDWVVRFCLSRTATCWCDEPRLESATRRFQRQRNDLSNDHQRKIGNYSTTRRFDRTNKQRNNKSICDIDEFSISQRWNESFPNAIDRKTSSTTCSWKQQRIKISSCWNNSTISNHSWRWTKTSHIDQVSIALPPETKDGIGQGNHSRSVLRVSFPVDIFHPYWSRLSHVILSMHQTRLNV